MCGGSGVIVVTVAGGVGGGGDGRGEGRREVGRRGGVIVSGVIGEGGSGGWGSRGCIRGNWRVIWLGVQAAGVGRKEDENERPEVIGEE